MALMHTPEKMDDFQAVNFDLPGVDGKNHALSSIQGEKGTLILFICNHCPYVKGVIERLVQDVSILQQEGIGVAAIMSNDTEAYPADSFENMKIFAEEHKFTFPYLIDETQEIARSYGAICTPDLFGFNADGVLQYRGRIDSAGKDPADATTQKDMLDAMLRIAATGQGPAEQYPSMGCSIKWKE